jgi:hypothetical protein
MVVQKKQVGPLASTSVFLGFEFRVQGGCPQQLLQGV